MRYDAGFSLVEVLVALAIQTSIGVVAAEVLMNSSRRAESVMAKFRAVIVADSLIERAALDLPLSPERQEGREADGTRWAVIFEPYAGTEAGLGSLPIGLVRVEVTATPPGVQAAAIKLQTLVALDRMRISQ